MIRQCHDCRRPLPAMTRKTRCHLCWISAKRIQRRKSELGAQYTPTRTLGVEQRIRWFEAHPELWHGWPFEGPRREALIEALRADGIFTRWHLYGHGDALITPLVGAVRLRRRLVTVGHETLGSYLSEGYA